MSDEVLEATRAVQVWAYPLLFAQRVRLNFTQPLDPVGPRPPTSAGAPLDALGHQRRLSDPGLAVGVAPNVDTRYSVAWLDVRHGDAVLRLPRIDGRYASVQIALPDSSTLATVDADRPGDGGLVITLGRGPDAVAWDGDTLHVRTRWRYVMVVVRLLVHPADSDHVDVTRLQDAMTLTTTPVATPRPDTADRALAVLTRADETRRPEAFALALRTVLDDAAPEAVDAATADAIQRSRLLEDPLPPALLPTLAEGLRRGLEDIEGHVRVFGRTANGWAINDTGTDFGDDRLLRAAVAHAQIFINPATEATYPVCEVDAAGDALDGARHRYRLTFAADDLPPVHAFWSLTAYHARGLLVANDLGRHAIGDRTPGLRRGTDGSLTVELGVDPPERLDNWLPVPAGPFRLMLRLYRPSAPAWTPPEVVVADARSARQVAW